MDKLDQLWSLGIDSPQSTVLRVVMWFPAPSSDHERTPECEMIARFGDAETVTASGATVCESFEKLMAKLEHGNAPP
jgi:hypothetical protein